MPKTTLRPPMRKDGDGHKHSYSYNYRYGYAGYGREKRPRTLNFKLLIGTIVFFLVAVPATYLWHDYQTKQLSATLWEYGKQQAAEENWKVASAAFYRVWDIQKDPKLLGDAVAAYDKLAANSDRPGVIAAYQRAIGGLPERLDLRVRLAELLTAERQYKSALLQTDKVLAADPNHLAARKWRALALLGTMRNKQPVHDVDVLEELKRAYIDQQSDFEIAAALVSHIRDDLHAQNGSELAAQADGVVNRLVAANPRSVRARIVRYNYRVRHQLPGAKRDIEQAVLLDPKNPAVVSQAAWDSLRDAAKGWKESDYLTARQLFKELISLAPKNEAGYLGLGDTEFLVAGNMQRAIEIWSRGREQAGDSLPLLLRIAEAQTNSMKFDQLEQTLHDIDQFIVALPSTGAEQGRNWAKASVALFRGKMLLAQERPLEAIDHLKLAADLGVEKSGDNSIRPSTKSTPYAALMSLGETYQQLGRARDAAASFARALKLNPDSESALLASAEAWSELGDFDRALKNIQQALRIPQPSAQVHRLHAQYLLERELAIPSRDRDWRDFEDALKTVRNQLAESWELRLLEVDYAIHRNRNNQEDNSEALGKLLAMEQDFPNVKELWEILPFAYEALGLRTEADRALNKLELLTSSSPQTKFLTIDLLLWRRDTAGARRVLESVPSEALSSQELFKRDLAMLRIYEFEANDSDIDGALVAYRSRDAKNAFAVERLLDRRVCNASVSKIPSNADLIKDLKIRQPEAQATWQYYEARLELAKAQPDISKVQKLLTSLANRLPYWSRTLEIAGRLALAEGNDRDARIAFEGAVAKPNVNPELIRLIIDDNIRSGDFLACTRLIESHRQVQALSRTLNSGSWSALQRKLDFAFVDRGLERNSQASSAMWTALLGRDVETAPTQDLASLMFSLWHADDSSTDISALISHLEGMEFETADRRAFILGQAYHLAGDLNKAKQQYRAVIDDSENRLRAEIYAGKASAQLLRQRSRELDLANTESRSKLRLEAIMKLRRAGRNDLQAAQQLLETLVSSPSSDPIDRILMARCLQELGNPAAAVKQLELVVEQDASAYHISILTDFLLRDGQYDKAEVWIDQLEEQTGWQKKTALLRARWMVATNRITEIKPFVEMFATERFKKSPRNPAMEMRDVSDIYLQVGLLDDAERWLETLTDRFPQESERLSQLLVDNDEMDRAIQRCVDQLEDAPNVETATLLARILVYGEANQLTVERVLPLLHDCQSRFQDAPSFLFALGNVHIRLADQQKAIELLTRVTELQPGHYLAWNNLAAVLAEEEGRQGEAMKTIDKAIELAAYEMPTLLDTKAVVLMHQDRFQAAARLLRDEVTPSRAATDPRFYFHLAMALERLNEMDAARDALQESIGLDLDQSFLTNFEQAELARLLQLLNVDAP